MTATTDRAMHEPVGPDEVDVLQSVFDAVLTERRLQKQSVEALDIARNVIRLYFDGLHRHDELLDAYRAEEAQREATA
jgi:hypothetical protein